MPLMLSLEITSTPRGLPLQHSQSQPDNACCCHSQLMMPAWVDHINQRSDVFDGDNVFLAGQDRVLAQHAQQEGASWRE